jgi:hypothetical protein
MPGYRWVAYGATEARDRVEDHLRRHRPGATNSTRASELNTVIALTKPMPNTFQDHLGRHRPGATNSTRASELKQVIALH